jgi:hypothetical protein
MFRRSAALFALATLVACGKRPAPQEVVVVPAPSESVVPTPEAPAPPVEPQSAPLHCGEPLFVAGREWIEEHTTSSTSVGTGGYMGQVWDGVRKTERRTKKKILSLSGETITEMRISFLTDTDGDEHSMLEGRTFVLVAAGGEGVLVRAADPADDAELESQATIAAAPEMTRLRLRGDARTLAPIYRNAIGWNQNPNEDQPPWGRITLIAKKAPRDGVRAFGVAGVANDAAVGLGHGGRMYLELTGTILVSKDGALLEERTSLKTVLAERLNHGCGDQATAPCPWITSATTTTVETLRAVCE